MLEIAILGMAVTFFVGVLGGGAIERQNQVERRKAGLK